MKPAVRLSPKQRNLVAPMVGGGGGGGVGGGGVGGGGGGGGGGEGGGGSTTGGPTGVGLVGADPHPAPGPASPASRISAATRHRSIPPRRPTARRARVPGSMPSDEECRPACGPRRGQPGPAARRPPAAATGSILPGTRRRPSIWLFSLRAFEAAEPAVAAGREADGAIPACAPLALAETRQRSAATARTQRPSSPSLEPSEAIRPRSACRTWRRGTSCVRAGTSETSSALIAGPTRPRRSRGPSRPPRPAGDPADTPEGHHTRASTL